MNKDIGHNWLLLRGLSRESAHWGDFVPLLRAAFPYAQVHTLDLPGTGRFHGQLSPCRIEDILTTTRDQAMRAGLLQKPVTLLALSLGGMVAWEWMRQYPQDVCAGVLINSSFASLSPFYRRLRRQSYRKFFQLLAANSAFDRELDIVRLVSNRCDQDRIMTAEIWTAIHQLRPVSLKNSWRQIRAAALYRPDNRNPNKPVLLLNSLGDRLVSPACSAAIQQKWNLELRSHPSAGHDLPLDAGEWVVDQLKNWTASI
jgi:pimeloyl-ACP methyl ester carboxylesterase